MKAPVEGTAGMVWRSVTAPLRIAAPAVSMASRVIKSEFWVETERRRQGNGPQLGPSSRQDIQRPRDGAGPLNHRTYQAHIVGSERTPSELISEFRRNPNRFSPTSFATFEAQSATASDDSDARAHPDELAIGDAWTVRLPGPWDGPVVVTEAEPRSVKLETLGGHMEAGSIRFSAEPVHGEIVFEIESIARSGDPVFDALYHPGKVARLIQTEMWVRVLEAMVDFSGGRPSGRVIVDTTIYEGPDQ